MEILKKTPAMGEEKSPREDRIVLLSDGVFAIAMTLLILDVRLPEGLPHSTFSDALNLLLPKFIGYVITFILISTYWSIHRRLIHYLTRIDASFIQLNLLLLFFVTALPISTTFVFQEQYTDQHHLSTIIYTLSLAMTGFTLAALWLYATWKHRLVDPNLEHDIINYLLLRSFIAPVIFLLSLLILLLPGVDPNDVYFSWLVIYIVYIILRRARKRLFPRLIEPSEQSAEAILVDPTPVRES